LRSQHISQLLWRSQQLLRREIHIAWLIEGEKIKEQLIKINSESGALGYDVGMEIVRLSKIAGVWENSVAVIFTNCLPLLWK
jgi:hypothetical protein